MLQKPGKNTVETQNGEMSVLTALHCEESGDCYSQGDLYIDDGISKNGLSALLRITANATSVTVSEIEPPTFPITNCSATPTEGLGFTINDFVIYGVPGYESGQYIHAFINGNLIPDEFVIFHAGFKRLRILALNEDWCLNKVIVINWAFLGPQAED